MSVIALLQDWYKFNCNGDWEHQYGVKINTVANPGWSVLIDLADTALEDFTYFFESVKSDDDWVHIKTENNVFIAGGDPTKLEIIAASFLYDFLRPKLKESTFTYEMYAPIVSLNIWRPVNARMIDVGEFQIVEIPKSEWRTLKAFHLDDFQKVDKEMCLKGEIEYQVGDVVRGELVTFYDYPSLVIVDKR